MMGLKSKARSSTKQISGGGAEKVQRHQGTNSLNKTRYKIEKQITRNPSNNDINLAPSNSEDHRRGSQKMEDIIEEFKRPWSFQL